MAGIPNIDIDHPNYGPPNMAAQLFGMISSLPDAYQQGVKQKFERGQMARTEELQKPYTGPLDPTAIMQESIRRGGIDQAQQYVAPLLGMLSNAQINQNLGGGGPPQTTSGVSIHGQDPNLLHGAAGEPPAGQPQLSSMGTDDKGNDTVRGLATERGINVDAPGFKQAFGGIGLDRELTPAQAAGVVKRFALFTKGNTATDAPQPGSPEPTQAGLPAPPGASPPSLPPQGGGSPADRLRALGMSRLTEPGEPQPGQFGQFAQAGVPAGGPATPVGNEAQAKFYEDRGNRRMAASALYGASPKAAEAAQKAAEADFARAKAIRETSAKYGETLDPRIRAVKTQEEAQKADIETSKKTYAGLQNLGQAGQLGNQKLDRIRAVMSDPGFMSGAGHELAQAWKQWSVTLGGDPKAAQPMEEFHKTAQQLLSDDIKAMGASGAGPVRVAEVQIMKQATANLGISPAANRYLVEEAYRVHNDNVAVARLAQQYKQQHGYLDPGWDAVRDKYYADHPLFTKAELADPRLVSPPYLPKDVAADPAKHAAWVRAQGIKPGDPIKTDDPNRQIVYAR